MTEPNIGSKQSLNVCDLENMMVENSALGEVGINSTTALNLCSLVSPLPIGSFRPNEFITSVEN